MFPSTEELPPERREMNPVSFPSRSGGHGKGGCLACACWEIDLGSAVFAQLWQFCYIRQLFGEQQGGEWQLHISSFPLRRRKSIPGG